LAERGLAPCADVSAWVGVPVAVGKMAEEIPVAVGVGVALGVSVKVAVVVAVTVRVSVGVTVSDTPVAVGVRVPVGVAVSETLVADGVAVSPGAPFLTVVLAVEVSTAGLPETETLAALFNVVPALAVTLTVTKIVHGELPVAVVTSSLEAVQVTVPLTPTRGVVHDPWLVWTDAKVVPMGSVSLTLTFAAAPGPPLSISIL
jgi:hypothetical protein